MGVFSNSIVIGMLVRPGSNEADGRRKKEDPSPETQFELQSPTCRLYGVLQEGNCPVCVQELIIRNYRRCRHRIYIERWRDDTVHMEQTRSSLGHTWERQVSG